MAIPVYHKAVATKFTITLTYQTPDLKAGETITQATATSVPAGLTLGTPGIDGASVSVQVSGGVAGKTYRVQFNVKTSAGNEYEDPWKDAAIVKVR